MVKQVVITPHPAKLPYSQGIKTEQFIFVAGQTGHKNRDTGEEIKGIEAQTRQCLEGMKEILESAGSSLSDVVNATVYLKNPGDFPQMNEVYKSYFPKDPPARATVIANLVSPSILVEIQSIACYSSGQ